MARDEKMDDIRLCSIVKALVGDAQGYANERSADREEMMVYYDGDADKLQQYIPADEGRSKVVSRDVRAAVRKVLPSVLRTILGNDEIVEYVPVGEGDEASAEQASDYVNYVVIPECSGRLYIEDVINDAIRLRNGVLKWFAEEKTEVTYSTFTGLDEMAFVQLVESDEIDVLEHTEREELIEVPGPEGAMQTPIPVHDVRIKRTQTRRIPSLSVVQPENFLIDSRATSFDSALLIGEHTRETRSDLVKMGYDRDVIYSLPTASDGTSGQEAEESARRRDIEDESEQIAIATQEIEYYDLLVRLDFDGDGIAELRRLVFAGGLGTQNLLENVEWDEINYCNVISERRPHQWEGNSVTDEVKEVQKVKTALLRQTMDNLYWQNNLQPIAQQGNIKNPEAVLNPQFGQPIFVEDGVDVRAALGFHVVPMVADKSFAMLEYMDGEAADRTGINEASSGMAPDALQNMTAKATSLIEQAGIGQTEMMVKCLAESLKPAFKGLLKLTVENQDIPRTVRLRDKWVTFDPRSWNAHMDAVVNIGLGAGTRERDMMMMQQVIGLQERILTAMGPAVGMQYVSPENVYNSVAKLVEAAGLRSTGLYFTQPDPEAIQKAIEAQSSQPSEAEIRAQTAVQVEEARQQGRMQVEQFKSQSKIAEFQAKMQADANKEREQRDADLVTELQRIQADAEARMEAAMLKFESDREGHAVDIEREAMKQQTEREWMATQAMIAERKMQADVQKTQAQAVGKALDRQRHPDGNRQGRAGR